MYITIDLNKLKHNELSEYIRNKEHARKILMITGFYKKNKKCAVCKKINDVTRAIKTGCVRCIGKGCVENLYLRKGTILYNSNYSYKNFLLFLHLYFNNIQIKYLNEILKGNKKTIIKLKNIIDKEMCRLYDRDKVYLQGNHIVEVDESVIAKRKYNSGRLTKMVWVFGLIERDTGKCHIEIVQSRDKKTLEKIIKKHVAI
ncbi:hypothetical protein DMUE_1754 [Dictyocoela muelleri]|nr:hypothetical protein DMUE_1754 [Dictyocoela muelleri]